MLQVVIILWQYEMKIESQLNCEVIICPKPWSRFSGPGHLGRESIRGLWRGGKKDKLFEANFQIKIEPNSVFIYSKHFNTDYKITSQFSKFI